MEEPEVNSKNLEKMPAISLSLTKLHEALHEMTQRLDLSGGGTSGQIRRDVQCGCILADSLWNLKEFQRRRFNRTFTLQGHVGALPQDEDGLGA